MTPMSGIGIVTLADSRYFPGTEMLYLSARKLHPVPVVCFDLGITDEQKDLATRSYPELLILPVPETADIAAVREAFGDSGALAKPGKRVWPLWACPFLIAASPFKRVFWIDSDIVILRDLRGLFALLEDGPVFTPENFAPEATPNKPELYELLPIRRAFNPKEPTVNAGVSGWDLERDQNAIEAYMLPVRKACADPRVAQAISWHDQGALIWAIQNTGLEHRVAKSWKWNLCVKHTRAIKGPYDWNEGVIDTLRRDAPEANLLHWNGHAVPWVQGRASKQRRLRDRLASMFRLGASSSSVRKQHWAEGREHEITFWNRWLADKASPGYRFRVDPHSRLQEWLIPYLDKTRSTHRILDVGSGPLTNLGKVCDFGVLEIVCCDPLAEVYGELLAKNGIVPPHPLHQVAGEQLTTVFSEGYFDLTFSNNAIDHATDPAAVVSEMLKVTRAGGYVIIQVSENEGERAGYEGLHQWDCAMRDGRFLIKGRNRPELDMGQEFAGQACIMELAHVFRSPAGLSWDRPHVRVVLQKKAAEKTESPLQG
jgi:SAM-dependent methyltransferase